MNISTLIRSLAGLPVLLLMTLACQSGGEVKVDSEISAVADPCPTVPAEDASQDQQDQQEQADEPFVWSKGTYWIRRHSRQQSSTSMAFVRAEPSADDNTAGAQTYVKTTRGGTRCQRLEFDPDERELRMTISSYRDRTSAFRVTEVEGGLSVTQASTRGRIELSRSCNEDLFVEPMAGTPGVLVSNAGVIFEDRDRCEAAPSRYEYTCIGGECSYDEPTAEPFRFSQCEDAMNQIRGQVSRIVQTSEDAALESLLKLRERIDEEGELWERRDGEEGCRAVSIEAVENDRLRFTRHVHTDGGYHEKKTVYDQFRPLSNYAREHSASSWFVPYEDSNTVGGGWGRGSQYRQVKLYLAEGSIFLGDRFLYFDPEDCAR